MKKYSVLMSLYRKEQPEYLKLAIQSVINQTILPDEIVIVKDGEITKDLQSVLDECATKYPNLIKIVGYTKNRGLGFALNYGLERTRNELVARMDTDDISKPDRCEKQLKMFAANPDLAIVGAYVDEFFSNPDEILSVRVVPTTHDGIYEFAKRRSAFNHPVVMYKKSAVFSVGGYHDLRRNQDVDLFGRMLYSGCRAANIGESLLWFRSNEDLAKRRRSWENTKSYIGTIKKFWEMGYSSFGDFVLVLVAQIGMFLCPTKLQHWIYKKFLRN